MQHNINKDYKKTSTKSVRSSTLKDKQIADKLDISDSIDTTAQSEAFITLKDHKPNFTNKPTCRLINRCKSEIGKISKQILEIIKSQIIKATNLNQWKNTDEVIQWFNGINNKQKCSFIALDVCEFYPSITEDLISNALSFPSKYDNISDDEKHIILQAKESTLYNRGSPWSKRDGNSKFDVTMGSFDGAETCELIGIYLLSQLQHLDINIFLYRDDGLEACHKTSRQVELLKKKICALFAKKNLRITIDANKNPSISWI